MQTKPASTKKVKKNEREYYHCSTCGEKIHDSKLKDPADRECPKCGQADKFIDFDPILEKQSHIELCNRWAKNLYNLKINVIPIKYKSKVPHGFKKGEIEQWHYKRIPRKVFDRWCREKRFENVAILGGHISQDLVCLDFDNPEEFKALSQQTKDKNVVVTPKNLIETGAWVTETPKELGRYHVVVRDKNEVKNTRLEKHIDYRANEHYWLVYPSIHPNGKRYNFLNTHKPDELKLPKQIDTIELFETWDAIIDKKTGTSKRVKETTETKEPFDKGPDCVRNAWKLGAGPGMRYYLAQALGSYLQQQGIPLEVAQDIVINWFNTKCNTTGRPVKDIKKSVSLAYKKRKYSTGCRYWRNKTTFCPYEKKEECKFYNPLKDKIIEIKGEAKDATATVEKLEEEAISEFHSGFIGIIEKYFNGRTNAPLSFATHLAVQIIGFAMGVECVHMIQPKPIHHNTYTCLIGTSTITRKTTAQDLAIDLILDTNFLLPSGFSPQGLLKALSDIPHGYLPMGEFSSVLRGIKGASNMADLKEILNEIHRCPEIYQKKLVKMKDSFTIFDPYLSFSTTCTEEEFFPNLTEEVVYGGFCARIIFTKGNSRYRPRNKLPTDAMQTRKDIRKTLWKIYELIAQPKKDYSQKKKITFEFTEDGLEEFNRIDKMLTFDPYWQDVKPFVGRMLDYLIVYSDILFLSDVIDAIGIDQFNNLTKLTNITNLTNLTLTNNTSSVDNNISPVDVKSCTCVKLVKLVKLIEFDDDQQSNSCKFLVVKLVVQKAWEILRPCLEYTKEIVRYYNENAKVGRLLPVLEKHAPLQRSTALQYSHLIKKDFDDSIETLKERETVFELNIQSNKSDGRGKPIKKIYCTRKNIDTPKCKKCQFKCKLEHRIPELEGI